MKKTTLREEPAGWSGKPRASQAMARAGKSTAAEPSQPLGSSTITARGQTTIPKKVRDRLGLRPGSRLDFELTADGSVRLRGASVSALSLFGFFGKPKRHLTIAQINEATKALWTRRA